LTSHEIRNNSQKIDEKPFHVGSVETHEVVLLVACNVSFLSFEAHLRKRRFNMTSLTFDLTHGSGITPKK